MNNYQELSEKELQAVIDGAAEVLKTKQQNKRKEVIAKIKELAASIDVSVEIQEGNKSSRKGIKVPIKYRHPDDPSKVWTGRGVTPKWMQALLKKGNSKEDFTI
jgi:DNA-binding protein H-NS